MSFIQHVVRLVKVMRWRALGVLLLLGATGLLESAAVILLIPLLGAVGLDVQQGSVGRLASYVTSGFAAFGVSPTLPLVLVVFLAVNATLALLRRAHTITSASLEQEVTRQTAERLYRAIIGMNWLAFSRMRASDLTVALTSESERVGLAAAQLVTMAASLVVTAVYIGLAFRLSFQLTAAVSVCGAALLLLLRRRTTKAARLGARLSDTVHEFHAAISDDLAGMKTIRSFAAEPRSYSRMTALAGHIAAVRRDSTANFANATFWVELGSVAMLSLLVFVAVGRLAFNLSSLLLLLFLFARIVPRLASLQQNLNFYVNLLPSGDRLAALEARCLAAADPAPAAPSAFPTHQQVRLRSVSFQYAPSAPAVLSHLDLAVDAGTTVAIVGPSGSGKTTLVDVMMGLLTPQAGEVLVDDRPLNADVVADWRQAIVYVPQDTFLFHDTIRANLQWAVPNATDDDMRQALTMAAADFVFELEAGFDTVVGDRGVRLSGGERQRIALARALLRRPWVLILDEATSALDSENERRIFGAIQRLHGRMTIVIVTHRVSSLGGVDVIHVLEDGRVVESGTWARLVADRRGRFRELCAVQGVPAAVL